MGKTQRMIDELIKAVQEGQPRTVVICASDTHVSYMMYRVCTSLTEAGEEFTLTRGRPAILIDESRIDFVSIYEIDLWRLSRRGYGEFWDHYADFCYDRYVDQTTKECTGN